MVLRKFGLKYLFTFIMLFKIFIVSFYCFYMNFKYYNKMEKCEKKIVVNLFICCFYVSAKQNWFSKPRLFSCPKLFACHTQIRKNVPINYVVLENPLYFIYVFTYMLPRRPEIPIRKRFFFFGL